MKRNIKNMLIAAGGTGGHLYPAIALIEHIKKNYPETSIAFIGSEKGPGKRLIPGMGIEFFTVRARGLAGERRILKKLTAYILFFIDLMPGFITSFRILRKKKIEIILGMGGYICAPVIMAAIFKRIPFALHEQNFIPGRLNRLFSGRAKYFFTSFKDTEKYISGKNKNIVFSGNPVRESVKKSRNLAPCYEKWGLCSGRFTITVLGGSQGAEKINSVIIKLYDFIRNDPLVQILLIAGTRFYGNIIEEVKKIQEDEDRAILKIFPYVDEIEQIYRITDLIIARAGASTVSETAAAGIPSILIPYPFAIDNHQFYNARYLEERGEAVLIDEKQLSPGLLAEKIRKIRADDMKLNKKIKSKLGKIKIKDSQQIISAGLLENDNG
jgi:UDP-N-acetylglucosamine--N-acetylmuramyl-(pentapeptide) pyrophosphoryl-undecaprenol N-acetylglucosamine transferase